MIGLDVGQARVGVARASLVAKLAEPLEIIETNAAVDWLRNQLATGQITAIVTGLPRGLDGQETDQTSWVRQWVEQAKAQLATKFYWQDEALTTKQTTGDKMADAAAAALILQDWLDTPPSQRQEG